MNGTLQSLRPVLRPVYARAAIVLLIALGPGLGACDESTPTGTEPAAIQGDAAPGSATAVDVSATAISAAAVALNSLPFNKSLASNGVAFGVTQTGNGPAGIFRINKATNSKDALLGQSNGNGGAAVRGIAAGSAGAAGLFESTNPNSIASTLDIKASHRGTAASFSIVNPSSFASVLSAETNGTGVALFARAANSQAVIVDNTSANSTLVATQRGTGFAGEFRAAGGAGKGVLIQTVGGAGLQVVGGSKNAVVHTPSGAKALYTEESTEVWFTDYGFGRLANGRARVLLDPSFSQTINPDEPYHVFLQVRGNAELYVGETTPLGFEVALRAGDPNAEFSYRIVAKRLGFEAKRLEPAPWADQLGMK